MAMAQYLIDTFFLIILVGWLSVWDCVGGGGWSSFYEDFLMPNHFPLCLLPLQYVATPKSQSQYDSIKIDKTKHKSCKFYNLGQPTHSIQPTSINLEYQSALLCTLALEAFFRSTVPGMQATQTPFMFICHQKSFLSFLSSLVYANMATNMFC